ncbi:hypothetical protein QBC32DRAFT_311938 [Pseudoneurospora amorphoporcata]|uniref:Uncharacterized protein n=1 Tax=Pseudoneurospora amorphoporcata TaxID=241081 RepID=A0AAN6SIC5_9PEZI|nr:hypothetical protein QBC32DRAFT_311938 [Pseudoneurospora amorphoporcata]
MAGPHQDKDADMSKTSSFTQGTTSLAIRNRAAPQDMVAANTSITSAARDAILQAADNVDPGMKQLVHDLARSADPVELGLAQLRIQDEDAKAGILKIQQEARAAISELQESAEVAASNFEYFDMENKILHAAQRTNEADHRDQEGWHASVRRAHEERMDRIERRLGQIEQGVAQIKMDQSKLDMLVSEKTKSGTVEGSRAS